MHNRTKYYTRISIILIGSILVWKLALLLSDLIVGSAYTNYSLDRHVVNAVMVFLLAVPLVVLCWKFLDKKSFRELGFELSARSVKNFLVGMCIWLVPGSLGLALCLLTGLVNIELIASFRDVISFVPLLALLVFLYEAFAEELIFRGYIYSNLSEKFKDYQIVFIQALLFTLWGVAIGAAGSVDRLVFLFAFSWVQGSLRMVSGNVWVPIGFHLGFQTIAQLFLNESRGFFLIENIGNLQLVAFGLLPFLTAEIIARFLFPSNKYKHQ